MENNKTNMRFKLLDYLYLAMMIVPLVAGMVIKILTKPAGGGGIEIAGAQIFFTVPMPVQDLIITESQINSWLVMITIFGLCLYLTHGIRARVITKRQAAAEWIVESTVKMVRNSMGEDKYFGAFPPFIASILVLSALSSLITLVGLFPPTSDINVVGGWAILVFILITSYKLKSGVLGYLKGFTEPVFVMTPLNILGEVATPVSMAFRHYGNVISGSVIAVLVSFALQGFSRLVFGWLPGFLGEIPFLQIGLPAILSVYFDIFSGCMQAYIFAMLTMLNISGAFSIDDYEAHKLKKARKANN